jgi:hypothetical protein
VIIAHHKTHITNMDMQSYYIIVDVQAYGEHEIDCPKRVWTNKNQGFLFWLQSDGGINFN